MPSLPDLAGLRARYAWPAAEETGDERPRGTGLFVPLLATSLSSPLLLSLAAGRNAVAQPAMTLVDASSFLCALLFASVAARARAIGDNQAIRHARADATTLALGAGGLLGCAAMALPGIRARAIVFPGAIAAPLHLAWAVLQAAALTRGCWRRPLQAALTLATAKVLLDHVVSRLGCGDVAAAWTTVSALSIATAISAHGVGRIEERERRAEERERAAAAVALADCGVDPSGVLPPSDVRRAGERAGALSALTREATPLFPAVAAVAMARTLVRCT